MYTDDLFKQQMREDDISRAKVELTQLQAMKVLATNPEPGAEINISVLKIGVSVIERLIPVIDAEIDEVEKFLRGEPNNWQ